MEFEIGTAMGVSTEARIEELNSLSECYNCRTIRIQEEVRKEMDEEQGIYLCKHGFNEGEDCSICEHDDGMHVDDYEPEYSCPLCDNPKQDRKEAEELFTELWKRFDAYPEGR
jgi:rubrerythrin